MVLVGQSRVLRKSYYHKKEALDDGCSETDKEIDFLISFFQHYHCDSFSGLYHDDIALRHFVVAFCLWRKWSSFVTWLKLVCKVMNHQHKIFRRVKGQNVCIIVHQVDK